MSEIKVDFGALESGQAGIARTHGQLMNTLHELESNLQPMLASWEGTARDAYYQAKQQWDTAAEAMATTLNQIGTLVGTANSNYQQAESSATNTWS